MVVAVCLACCAPEVGSELNASDSEKSVSVSVIKYPLTKYYFFNKDLNRLHSP